MSALHLGEQLQKGSAVCCLDLPILQVWPFSLFLLGPIMECTALHALPFAALFCPSQLPHSQCLPALQQSLNGLHWHTRASCLYCSHSEVSQLIYCTVLCCFVRCRTTHTKLCCNHCTYSSCSSTYGRYSIVLNVFTVTISHTGFTLRSP